LELPAGIYPYSFGAILSTAWDKLLKGVTINEDFYGVFDAVSTFLAAVSPPRHAHGLPITEEPGVREMSRQYRIGA
jgi:hypothetical protein